MSNILFPDIWGTIGKVAAIEQADTQRNFLTQERDAKASAAPFIQKALSGDRDALNEVATRHPDTAMKLAPLLERMDATQRTRAKEAADFTASAANAILQADPAERPAIYAQILADGKSRGFDLSKLPPQYTPQLDPQLRTYRSMAIPMLEHFKRSENEPTPVGAPGGGVPAPAASGPVAVPQEAIPTGQSFVSYVTGKHSLSPVAAAGVVGGLYQESGFNPNAVGDGGTAGGLGQWRLDRREGLTKFAQSQGKPASDPYVQLDYLVSEMKGGDMGAQRAYAMLQQAKTAEDATTAMMHFFRPQGYTPNNPQGGHGYSNRVQYSQQFMPQGTEQAVLRGPPGTPTPIGTYTPGTAQAQPAQAPAAPPTFAQGDGGPPGYPAGGGPQAQYGGYSARDLNSALPPGARFVTRGGKYNINNDIAEVMHADGSLGLVRLPPKREPGADKGLFGDSLTGRALTALRTLDPSTQDYAAAYAIMSKPQVIPDGAGGQQVIQPMDLSMFPKPTFAGGGQPLPGGPTPAGAPPPNQTQLPNGGVVTRLPGAGKPLDNSTRDDLKKIGDTALELPQLLKSFDPSFGGFMLEGKGDVDNWMKRNLPDGLGGSDPKGQAQWWQRYANFANLERNKLFGSALTPGETAAFNAAMVNPGMKPDQIKANLQRQSEIAQKALSRIANSAAASGYNKEAIEALIGTSFADLPPTAGAVPQAPPPGNANRPPLESFGR